MPLHKISDLDTDYRNTIQGKDIKGTSVYTQGTDEKIGTVNDVIVDDQGQLRTGADYYNRINYGQPEQLYSGQVNPSMGAGIPRNDYAQTTIHQPNPSPSQKEKNDGLNRALLGGLFQPTYE